MTEVRAELIDDRRIGVTWSPRFVQDNAMVKSIPGRRWSPPNNCWTVPLSTSTCRILREVYDDMLMIGPQLTAWAREEFARTAELVALAKADDAPLELLADSAPAVYAATSTRRYQRAGIRWLSEAKGGALLADEPTLGKTIQILGAIGERGIDSGNHLIIAPRSTLYATWAEEIHKWTPWHAFWMPDGRAKRERMLELFDGDQYDGPKFLIVNFAMLQIEMRQWCSKCECWSSSKSELKVLKETGKNEWPDDHYIEAHKTAPRIFKQPWPQLFDREWTSVTIDEAHMSLLGVRNMHVGDKNTQEGNGLISLRMAKDGFKIASTGTPIHGNALNFWSAFHWLRPDLYGSKWAFAESFLEVEENPFGKTIGDIVPHREAALLESLSAIMLRRTKLEVQPDLPEDMYIDHWVEMTGEQERQYRDLISEGELEMQGGALSTQGVLAEYTRRKQFAFASWRATAGKMVPRCGGAKEELLFRLLADRGVTGDPKAEFKMEGGFKYVIGSQFTRIIDHLEESFRQAGIPTLKITGPVSTKKRTEAKDSFQNDLDGPRVLLVNTITGGVSLTLDAMCDEMFILDETWVADDQFQLEGRIRNREIEKRVAVRSFHYLRTRGTIEEEIAASGLTQDDFQKQILDRSRGVNVKSRRNK